MIGVVGLDAVEERIARELSDEILNVGPRRQAHAIDGQLGHAAHDGSADLRQQASEFVQRDSGADGQQDFICDKKRASRGAARDREVAGSGFHGPRIFAMALTENL